MEGDDKPKRSRVGSELVARNPLLYHRAGVNNFKGEVFYGLFSSAFRERLNYYILSSIFLLSYTFISILHDQLSTDYVELAAAQGIVKLGGDKGMAWISINELKYPMKFGSN